MPPQPLPPPAWTETGVDPEPFRPAEWIAWVALAVGLVASRVLVAPDVLFEWDSANYALARRDFDVYEHQPHPPGSPGLVLLLRAFAGVVPGETGPFLALNTALSVATVALLGVALRRSLGPWTTLAMALAFSVCPLFWQQGAVSSAYVAECFCSVASLVTALGLARRSIAPEAAALVVALLLSLRPSAAPTLLPVVGIGLLLARQAPRRVAAAVAVGVTTTATWTGIAVAVGGGAERWGAASRALLDWQIAAGSAIGGGWAESGERAHRLAMYLLDAVNLLVLLVPLVSWTRTMPRPAPATALLWCGWVVPPVAVYALHHLPKSGYALTLVPAAFVALGGCLGAGLQARPRRASAAVAAGYIGGNTFAFLVAVPIGALFWPDYPTPPGPFVITGDYGRAGLAWSTMPTRQVLAAVRELDPQRDLAVWMFGTFEAHRITMATLPDHPMLAVSIDHRAALRTPWAGGPTFGDFQRTVLAEPPSGLVSGLPIRVDWGAPGRLRFGRAGRSFEVVVGHRPERIVIFAPCPPCGVDAGTSLDLVEHRRLGPEIAATWLVVTDDGG